MTPTDVAARPLLHTAGIELVSAWLAARTALQPAVAHLKLVAPRSAREIAGLRNIEEARRLCDDVMQHLGFTRGRLGRVELYIRAPIQEKRSHARPSADAGGNRAARRARE